MEGGRDGERERLLIRAPEEPVQLNQQENTHVLNVHGSKIGLHFYFGGTFLRLRVTSNIKTITREFQRDMTHLLSFFLVLLLRKEVQYVSLPVMLCW